jgi:mRNA interferase YafQ
MLDKKLTSQFKKDIKKYQNKKDIIEDFKTLINILSNNEKLEQHCFDHLLQNNYKGYRECHIRPDVLLIYKVELSANEIKLIRFGSHSELFK